MLFGKGGELVADKLHMAFDIRESETLMVCFYCMSMWDYPEVEALRHIYSKEFDSILKKLNDAGINFVPINV